MGIAGDFSRIVGSGWVYVGDRWGSLEISLESTMYSEISWGPLAMVEDFSGIDWNGWIMLGDRSELLEKVGDFLTIGGYQWRFLWIRQGLRIFLGGGLESLDISWGLLGISWASVRIVGDFLGVVGYGWRFLGERWGSMEISLESRRALEMSWGSLGIVGDFLGLVGDRWRFLGDGDDGS